MEAPAEEPKAPAPTAEINGFTPGEVPQPQRGSRNRPAQEQAEPTDSINAIIGEIETFRQSIPDSEGMVRFEAGEGALIIGGECQITGDVSTAGDSAIAGHIEGKVSSGGNTEVWKSGSVTGELDSKGNVVVYGRVDGSIKGENVKISSAYAVNSTVECNVLLVQRNCVLVGDVDASAVKIEGAVKGNVTAKDRVVLEKGAIVKGDVEAPVISVQEGVFIEGTCRQVNKPLSVDDFFEAVLG